MITLLFIGDIVDEPGLTYLEAHLPALIEAHRPHFVIANAENLNTSVNACGMTSALLARLFALGVDVVTGGNHSWDGPEGLTVHDDPRVLRPLNYGGRAPGRGMTIVEKGGLRLGVVNLISPAVLSLADHPLDVMESQLAAWQGTTDLILVDYHGESVMEKLIFAFAFDGRVTAVLGTHTHVQTADTRVLPGGTAYVTDVGMTGPGGGLQGYDPAKFVRSAWERLPNTEPMRIADGAVEFGAVLITCNDDGTAAAIARLST
jgi:hypothetical protein